MNLVLKFIWTYLFLIQFCISGLAQNWTTFFNTNSNNQIRVLYADSFDSSLYIAGAIGEISNENGTVLALKYNDGQFDSLAFAGQYNNGRVETMIRYNGNLYAGGTFNNLTDMNSQFMSIRNDVSNFWESPAVGVPDDITLCFTELDNDLYVGGQFDSVGNVFSPGIAKFNSEGWHAVNGGLKVGTRVDGITEFQNKLYIYGYLIDEMDNILRLAVYEDNLWHEPNDWQICNGICFVNSLATYNQNLYVAGQFKEEDGALGDNIVKYDGNTWFEIGGGIGSEYPLGHGTVRDMIVFQNKLWVVGNSFETAGNISVNHVAIWDDNVWCSTGSIFDGTVSRVVTWQGNLYIQGGYSSIDGIDMGKIVKWIGSLDSCEVMVSFNAIHDIADDWIISPNPCTTHYFLEFQQETSQLRDMTIYTLTGQQVMSEQLSGNQRHTIDVSDLEAGMYIVQVMENGQPAGTSKLVVQGR